jgi:hypothetical protein
MRQAAVTGAGAAGTGSRWTVNAAIPAVNRAHAGRLRSAGAPPALRVAARQGG